MAKSEWIIGLAVVAVLAMLPLVAHWARRDARPTCGFDGIPIDPVYAVRVVDADGTDRAFCCIGCAEQWLRRDQRPPRRILVTDETGGAEIDAAATFFVRSAVVTNRATGNRIHAFRDRADAERHAATFGGQVLEGADVPFR